MGTAWDGGQSEQGTMGAESEVCVDGKPSSAVRSFSDFMSDRRPENMAKYRPEGRQPMGILGGGEERSREARAGG
ncbi:unnamed protein product [Gadus morhua 'NCC']